MSDKTAEQYRFEFEQTIHRIESITDRAVREGQNYFNNPLLIAARDAMIGTAAQNALIAYNVGKIPGDEVLKVVERAVNACRYPTDAEE